MSDLRAITPVAIFCSDLHITGRVPSCRAETKDEFLDKFDKQWTQVMELGYDFKIPVFIVGDVMDRHNTPVDVINNVHLQYVDDIAVFAIPGQHDLPMHNYDLKKDSSYHTMEKCGQFIDMNPYEIHRFDSFDLNVFPWGFPIKPPKKRAGIGLQVAMIHAYCWKSGHCYHEDAPKEANIRKWHKELEGYDVAFFGDNHSHFKFKKNALTIFNCGTFMRRRIDEINYQPVIGVLGQSGVVYPYKLDCSADEFSDQHLGEHLNLDNAIVEKTRLLVEETVSNMDSIDFESVLRKLTGEQSVLREPVQNLILHILEEALNAIK